MGLDIAYGPWHIGTMTNEPPLLGPELILGQNDVYTRWLQLQRHEHLSEADAALRVSEDLGMPAEIVEDGIFAGKLTESEIRCREDASRYEVARAHRNASVLAAISRGGHTLRSHSRPV